MALDNIELDNLQAGDDVATDLIATDHYQYVKITYGAAGTANEVTSTATNPFPVALSDTDNAVLDSIAAAVHAEDSAHTSTDSGVLNLAVRNDELAALAGTDGDYAPLQVNADGALFTVKENDVVDSNNSTTSTLTANTDYTGTGTDLLGYAGVTVSIFADQDSDDNGMRFEFSTDNTNWDISQTFDYKASTGRQFQFNSQSRYFRVAFQNAGTGQTAFRLQTVLHRNAISMPTVHRADADIAVDRSATLNKSILMAQAGGAGDFTPIQGTTGGNLKVSLVEASDGLDIGAGNAGAETIRVSISTDDVNLASMSADLGTIDADTGNIAAGYAAEGAALGSGVLLQGDDGTDRKNINVDATTGDVQVDVTNTVTVDGSGVTQPVSGTVTANAGTNLNTSALLTTAAHDAAFGTAGSADAQVRTVQGVASMTPLLVDATGQGDVPITLGGEVVTVDLAGNNDVTVTSGTVTANLGATDNAVLDDIAAKLAPSTTNGHSFYLNQDTSAVASVKGSAGTIYWLSVQSTDATPVYLNLYNVASGSVTLGTTTPSMQFIVPSQGDANGAGLTINFGPHGIQFGTAITVAAATTFNGSTDPGTNVVITNIGYE